MQTPIPVPSVISKEPFDTPPLRSYQTACLLTNKCARLKRSLTLLLMPGLLPPFPFPLDTPPALAVLTSRRSHPHENNGSAWRRVPARGRTGQGLQPVPPMSAGEPHRSQAACPPRLCATKRPPAALTPVARPALSAHCPRAAATPTAPTPSPQPQRAHTVRVRWKNTGSSLFPSFCT